MFKFIKKIYEYIKNQIDLYFGTNGVSYITKNPRFFHKKIYFTKETRFVLIVDNLILTKCALA